MSKKGFLQEHQEALKMLPIYLQDKVYRQLYNNCKSYLLQYDVLKNIPPVEGLTSDEVASVASYSLIEDYVFAKLIPVYIFCDQTFKCIKWLTGHLKALEESLAELVIACQLLVLQQQDRFSQKEKFINVLVEELQNFDYLISAEPPLHPETGWITFFTGEPQFKGRNDQPLTEMIKADFAIRGFYSTPEQKLGTMIEQHPVAAIRKVSNLLPEIFEHNKMVTGSTQKPAPENTTARQVLALHYLLQHSHVHSIDQTAKARFIQFLTGKNYKNIYDLVRSPLATQTGKFRRDDLQFIRPFFEDLGLVDIVEMINKELEKGES